MTVENLQKHELHQAFWRGEGPSLIFIPASNGELYDTDGYRERFYAPEKMWQSEMRRAEAVVDWPSDGIPTVRPNLGTTFVPGIMGQDYKVQDGSMPWHGAPLSADSIRAARDVDVSQTQLMQLAAQFYEVHRQHQPAGIAAYQADTQSVLNVAHLLYGNEIFYEILDDTKAAWIDELFAICLEVILRTAGEVKRLLGEQRTSMIHGHGCPEGLYFPEAGIRLCEDTATLLSPAAIERLVLPTVEKAAAEFGGIFLHYCGKHARLFEMLTAMSCVKAIDLGNPESYDTRWLLQRCEETGTVLHSRLPAEPDESWEDYVRRLGNLVHETGARVVLRATLRPESQPEAQAMCDLWHELTNR